MKYPCDMIKDLLPLYYDEACSDQTKEIVQEHLSECSSCNTIMERMGNHLYSDRLQDEQAAVIRHYTRSVKKKALQIGSAAVAVPLLICLIVNLAMGNTLDWFFIVVTSLMVFVSVTAVPLLVEERKRLWTLGSFSVSIILLLFTCCLYNKGDWFFAAAVSTLFGLSVAFLPFVIDQVPLNGLAAQNRGAVVMIADTILFYGTVIAGGLYQSPFGNWKGALFLSTVGAAFAWALFLVIRCLKANRLIKTGICLLVSGVFFSLINDIAVWLLNGVLHISFTDANLLVWNTSKRINANAYLLTLLFGCVAGAAFLAAGLLRRQRTAAKK